MQHKKRELSNFSLQLLSMPDFLKSLNIGNSLASGRNSFIARSDTRYGPKTLMGNWHEKRLATDLVPLPVNSSYRLDYVPVDHEKAKESKITNFNMCDDLWAIGQGIPYQDLMRQGPPEEFQKNKSTLYDLTYGRACPELYRRKSKKARKITSPKPENDYALEYGNLTEYGLNKLKHAEWDGEAALMVRLRTSTMYKDDYTIQPFEPNSKRKSAYKMCSTSFNKILLDNKHWNTRGLPYRFASDECRPPMDPNRKLISIVPELD